MRRLPLPACLAATLLLAGCQREPIPVGGLFGLSGRHYDLGVSGRNGAILAVEELNAAGGIGGRRVELLVRDDAQDPETTRRAVRELSDRGVVAIVGPMTSAMAEAVVPLANELRVLLVSPTVSAARFRGIDDWLVMLFPSTSQSAAVLARRIQGPDGFRRLVVIHDLSNRAFSESWLEAMRSLLAPGGATVEDVPFTSGQGPAHGAVAEQALAHGPDGVLVVANALDAASICQQLRKRSATVRLYGTDWGFTQDVVTQGGQPVEGAVFTSKIDVEGGAPGVVRFRDAYRSRFSRPPDFAAAFPYEAVQLLADGLRRDATREGLRQAVLRVGEFPGLQGAVRVDARGDVDRTQHLMTVRDRRIVPAR